MDAATVVKEGDSSASSDRSAACVGVDDRQSFTFDLIALERDATTDIETAIAITFVRRVSETPYLLVVRFYMYACARKYICNNNIINTIIYIIYLILYIIYYILYSIIFLKNFKYIYIYKNVYIYIYRCLHVAHLYLVILTFLISHKFTFKMNIQFIRIVYIHINEYIYELKCQPIRLKTR